MTSSSTTIRRSWRLHAVGVALSLAVGGLAAVTPAEAASPPTPVVFASGLRVNHTLEAFDGFGTVVTGEVENVAARTLETVRVVLDQRDAAGRVLGSSNAFALAERLDPGERTAFKGYLLPVPGFASWSIRNAVGDLAIKPANHNFTLTVTNAFIDEYGLRHIQGTVRNDNTGPATAVTVSGQFLANGTTVDAEWTVPDVGVTMTPGEVAPFEIVRLDGGPHTSVVLTADANNDPSPLPTSVTISGGGPARSDRNIVATGRVVKRGTDVPVPGVHVEMHTQSAYNKVWTVPAGGTSDAHGLLRIAAPPQRHNTTLKLRVPATNSIAASESGTVFTAVQPVLELSGSKTSQVRTDAVLHVRSLYSGTIELQRRSGTRWVKVASKPLKQHRQPTSQKPPYAYHYLAWLHPVTPKAGKIQFRVVLPGTSLNAAGVSNVFTVKVFPL